MRAQKGSGSLFIARRGRFCGGGDKIAGEPTFCSCRGTWRRRGLGDTIVDELAKLKGAGGGVAWAAPTAAEARCGRRCAAKSSVGGAVGCQGGLAGSCERMRSGGAAL